MSAAADVGEWPSGASLNGNLKCISQHQQQQKKNGNQLRDFSSDSFTLSSSTVALFLLSSIPIYHLVSQLHESGTFSMTDRQTDRSSRSDVKLSEDGEEINKLAK